MKILVDADSCPRRVREVILRASKRTGISAVFIANRRMPDVVKARSDMRVVADADSLILEEAGDDDLVITRDIPLAAELVGNGIRVINVRGTVYTGENVRERLSWRDFMADLREKGTFVPESDRFGECDLREFANAFDRELTRLRRTKQADRGDG
ncbi:MAG: DUF188 domain-containing protein [Spirochaetales bacterium]